MGASPYTPKEPKNDIIDPNNFLPVSVVGIIKVNLLQLIFIAVLHPNPSHPFSFFSFLHSRYYVLSGVVPIFHLSFESAISSASGPCFSEVVTVVLLPSAAPKSLFQGHPHVICFKKKRNEFQNPFGIFKFFSKNGIHDPFQKSMKRITNFVSQILNFFPKTEFVIHFRKV